MTAYYKKPVTVVDAMQDHKACRYRHALAGYNLHKASLGLAVWW